MLGAVKTQLSPHRKNKLLLTLSNELYTCDTTAVNRLLFMTITASVDGCDSNNLQYQVVF